MAPDTPVLLSSGELATIKELFDRNSANTGLRIVEKEGGEFIKPATPLRVFSLDKDLKVVEQNVEWLYRGNAEKLYEVVSNRGKKIEVTSEHPFLVSRDGNLTWIPANQIKEGDFVATPRAIKCFSEKFVNIFDLLPESIFIKVKNKVFVKKNIGEILSYSGAGLNDRILSKILKSGKVGADELYKIANKSAIFAHLQKLLDRGLVSRQRTSSRGYTYSLNLSKVVDLVYKRGFSVTVFKNIGGQQDAVSKILYRNRSFHFSPQITPFFNVDEDLAKFIAIIIAEGYIGPSRIILHNTSKEIINFFVSYCEWLGFVPKQEKVGFQWKITINGAGTLMKILSDVFEVPVRGNMKSFKVKLPKIILSSPLSVLSSYLTAYLNCEGYIAQNRATLEITSASLENIVRLQYAFLRLGINAQIRSMYKLAVNSPSPKKRQYHALAISGSAFGKVVLNCCFPIENHKLKRLKKAASLPSNTNTDVVPVAALLRGVRIAAGLSQSALGLQGTITDYEDGSVFPSKVALQKVVSNLLEKALPLKKTNSEGIQKLTQLAFSDIYWEKIVSVKSSICNDYVYDLTVSKTHNFIAGHGSFVVHNTTTAMNLSSYLAMAGKKTLLIDFDPQFNATVGVGVNYASDETIYHAILADVPSYRVIKPTLLSNFEIVPASADLAGALIELVNVQEREAYLKNFIEKIKGNYDFIVIDLGPNLNLLTINGLFASNEVLIPVQCEYYSLEGLTQLLKTLDLVKENLEHQIENISALLTMYDKRERLSREVAREVRKRFPFYVFEIEIPRSVALAEAPSFRKPVALYAPQSSGALAYERLAKEILEASYPQNSGIDKDVY